MFALPRIHVATFAGDFESDSFTSYRFDCGCRLVVEPVHRGPTLHHALPCSLEHTRAVARELGYDPRDFCRQVDFHWQEHDARYRRWRSAPVAVQER